MPGSGGGGGEVQTRQQKEAEIDRLKKKNAGTLDNIIGTLEDTNKSADSTLSKLEKNTETMKRILEKQDRINENLAKGDKILGTMEGITGAGPKADDAFESAKIKPTSEDGYPVFHSGDIKKNGRHFADKFSKQWIMLHGNKISVHDCEGGAKALDIELNQKSKVMLFNSKGAPSELSEMYKDHPGGIAIFVDGPDDGRPWLFEAKNPTDQKIWIKAWQSQLEYIKLGIHKMWEDPRVKDGSKKNQRAFKQAIGGKHRKKDDKYSAEDNAKLDKVDDLLDMLDGKAHIMGDKIKEQAELTKKMQDNTTHARNEMKKQKDRIDNVMKETDKNWL